MIFTETTAASIIKASQGRVMIDYGQRTCLACGTAFTARSVAKLS